jgi:hypothetical protein
VSGYAFAVVLCLAIVTLLLLLLRTRRVREKYAGIWLVVGGGVCIFAAFPGLAFWLADLLGVETPVNLVFSAAMVVLLWVCIQLSVEVSNLEEETRTVAEELALLRLQVVELRAEAARTTRPGGAPAPLADDDA